VTTTYGTLLDELQRGSAVLLSSARVGPCQVHTIVVQRESGAIWQATEQMGSQAEEWSLRAQEHVYHHASMFADAELDGERLFRYMNFARAAEESYDLQERQRHEHSMGAAAVEAAERLMGVKK
jgi:hypothetical protein